MSALVQPAWIACAQGEGAASVLDERTVELEHRFEQLWYSSQEDTPVPGERFGRRKRWLNGRRCRRLIDDLAWDVELYPDDEGERREWRRAVEVKISKFGEERFGWPAGYRNLLVAEEFFDATVSFSRKAEHFDATIELVDVAQALRNVWIVNSLQILLGLEVALTPSVFAYSLLYPLTDNYLDDPTVPSGDKKAFNGRLREKLEGLRVLPNGRRQEQVFRLVEMIETQYPRSRYPAVFASLLAIHRGQSQSLTQQEGSRRLGREDLLRLSVRKGGASVLADGYLAAGELDTGAQDFCFGYGVFLQLLDDLQDVQCDLEAGHQTMFTKAATEGPLDHLTSRLYWFMHRVVGGLDRFAAARHAACKDLILRNCVALLVGAVAESPDLFSRRLRRRLEDHWPVHLGAMRRLRRRGRRRFQRAAENLCRTKGIEKLSELL